MNILDCELYQKDVQKSIFNVIGIEKLRKSKFLITGATGLVCSAIIDLLINSKLGIKIYAAGRDEKKVAKRFCGRVEFVKYNAISQFEFDIDVDYIIHGASNASPDLYVAEPVETMLTNINGMQNLLEYAREKKVKKVIYISSSEVYGCKNSMESFNEEQYGFIDLLNPRSSYPIAKRATETLCASYKAEYGIQFNIVRLGHIYGPSASVSDKRVSSDFAYKAAKGENLVLKSKGIQTRSYCYSLDCASGILSVLTLGKSGEAYNVSNSNSIINVRQMAEYLAMAGNVNLMFDLPSKADVDAFNPMDNSSLDSTKIECLGWKGLFGPKEGLTHTVLILKNCIVDTNKSIPK